MALALPSAWDQMRLASGTTQWRGWRATREMTACVRSSTARMTMEVPGGTTRVVSLQCGAQPPAERRPEPITELASGIWYVDLSRASMAQIRPALPTLAAATGVIFDLRGYPTDAGSQLLSHLITEPENGIAGCTSRTSRVRSARLRTGRDVGWNLIPRLLTSPADGCFH